VLLAIAYFDDVNRMESSASCTRFESKSAENPHRESTKSVNRPSEKSKHQYHDPFPPYCVNFLLAPEMAIQA